MAPCEWMYLRLTLGLGSGNGRHVEGLERKKVDVE